MSRAEALRDTRTVPVRSRFVATLRWLRPPVDSGAFWIVQVGVATVALLHEVILDSMHKVLPFGYPSSFTVSLLLIPVVYAALNFGVRGAAATAIWATVLMLPDLISKHFSNRPEAWIETSTLVMVNAVAVIVGQRVDHEVEARRRAEHALMESERAQERYRALFEEQHAPILVVSGDGSVLNANAAADELFGSPVGSHLSALLPGGLPDEGDAADSALRLQDGNGETRWFLPSVRELPLSTHGRAVQIVLADVTAEIFRREEQRTYARHLIKVQEEERRRLARDLHDDPLQTLTFLVRSFEGLSTAAELPAELRNELSRDAELADQTSSALREIIRGLRPPVLDDLGLEPALRHLAAEVAHRCRLPVTVSTQGQLRRLEPDAELALFRVAQEALNNVVRHSEAASATVELNFDEDVTLTVTDDGVGVPVSRRHVNGSGGLGIVGMRERLTQVAGTLSISALESGGTRVTARVPTS